MSWYKKRAVQAGLGLASIAIVAAACSSSSKGSTGTNGGTSPNTSGSSVAGTNGSEATVNGIPNQIFDPNSSGTPVSGGTLTMMGTGDVDFMDPNVSYYSIGYLGLRMWSRQLYTYPAVENSTTSVVPDLATAMPTITDNGTKYAVTIRTGAMWNTTPPRQVTAADVVLGVKRSCNPSQPFGGIPDYSDILAGYSTFCSGFGKVSGTSASAQAAYINGNQISGVSVDPSNPETVDFTLTKAASYFTDILALPPFAPAPQEYLQYVPASATLAQHTISDGPYYVASYDPAKSIVFKRNTAWQASTDPVRKAYVNEIDVNETGNQTAIQQQISTNTSAADMEWDSFVPAADIPSLVASKNPNFNLQSEYSSNPYIIFNTQSPNQNKALQNPQVRQAIAYAINRSDLIQDLGGPQVSPPLTQILPPGIGGSSPTYDPYPFNTAKAKSMLAAAGASHLTLKFLYRPASVSSSKIFQTLQSDLAAVGITLQGVGVPNADFYTKYLEVPTQAKTGVWDLSLAGWSPDWYGDAAKSFFEPLFDGRISPPTSSNFGLYDTTATNSATEKLIDQALGAQTSDAAASIWHQADQQVMADAAIYPITDGNLGLMRGSQVHNAIYVPLLEQIDPTNV
ncbi:MAG TPA: ABC transporter substrate-binding protein, partial [Acidimicrobiales bacterium]|nr:ABC transporter substrate-binding protein [Acidimicrobiales bacterium]